MKNYAPCRHRSDGRPCLPCIRQDLRETTAGAVESIYGFLGALKASQVRHPIPWPDDRP